MTALALRRGHYGRTNTRPLMNMCIYWHYLAAMWMAIFCVLLFGSGVQPAIDM